MEKGGGSNMKTLFINGKWITLDQAQPTCTALGIENDLITFIGSNEDATQLMDQYDHVIDLKGMFAMPGFNDSHMHLVNYGYTQNKMDLTCYFKIDELIEKGIGFIKEKNVTPDQWLLGRGWNQDKLIDKRLITRSDLDQISTEIPIVFTRVCGHMSVCNSAALGEISDQKKLNENPNVSIEEGLFVEEALNLLYSEMPSPDIAEIQKMILSTCDELVSYGITSVQSDDLCALPDQAYDKILQAYETLNRANLLKVKVYQQCLFFGEETFESFLNQGFRTGQGDDYFKIGPLKLLLDGSLGARTALLDAPYSDDASTRGVLSIEAGELKRIFELAMSNDIQVAAHAIGDGAMNLMLDQMETSLYKNKFETSRNGIVHAQITNPEILSRMVQNHVMAYVQPIFLDYDIHIVKERTGERANQAYAFKSMIENKLHVSMGTDAPVVHFNPFENIYCAVERKDLSGFPEDGYLPAEALSRLEAIRAYTLEGAYASFEEEKKGTLTIGKKADFIVLDENLLEIEAEKIKNVKVLSTYSNGKCVYQRTL